jgi:hypothetical protein
MNFLQHALHSWLLGPSFSVHLMFRCRKAQITQEAPCIPESCISSPRVRSHVRTCYMHGIIRMQETERSRFRGNVTCHVSTRRTCRLKFAGSSPSPQSHKTLQTPHSPSRASEAHFSWTSADPAEHCEALQPAVSEDGAQRWRLVQGHPSVSLSCHLSSHLSVRMIQVTTRVC